MTGGGRRARALAAGCFLALSTLPPAFSAAGDDREALQALRQRIGSLREEIAGAEEVRAEARDQLKESEQAISEANRALRELSGRRDEVRERMRRLGGEAQSAQAEIHARLDALGRLLAQRYMHGEPGYARLLLGGTDPYQAARELHYYAYLSRAQAAFIEGMRARVARLRDLEREARAAGAELAVIEAQQREERAALLARQAEKKRVLQRVSEQLRAQRREVRHLERDQARLARLVEELSKALAAAPRPKGRRAEEVPEAGEGGIFSRLRWKLRLPVRGELASRFGTVPQGGGPARRGLFIRAPAGTEVRAVAQGRVVFAEWMRGFGNLLIIDHGEAYLSIYGNGESLLKQVGDRVGIGEVIATTGTSGGSESSGLYFETRHQGRPFDPLRWTTPLR